MAKEKRDNVNALTLKAFDREISIVSNSEGLTKLERRLKRLTKEYLPPIKYKAHRGYVG